MADHTPEAPPAVLPLPLHLAPRASDGSQLHVKRRPGRPRKIVPMPDADEREYVDRMNEARDAHVDGDDLVRTVGEHGDPDDVLQQVVCALATEAASLAWEIRLGREAGKDTAQLSSRRIDALSKIALVELGRARLGLGGDLTPGDPRMDVVVDFFIASVGGVLETALPLDQAAVVTQTIKDRLHQGTTAEMRR